MQLDNKAEQERTIYLYAPQVHTGGGKVLLESLLNCKMHKGYSYAIVDERLKIDKFNNSWDITRKNFSFSSRLIYENYLRKNIKSNDIVIFFSNLPPLFKIKGKAIIFLQNKYIIDKNSLSSFSLKTRIGFIVQRLWFKLCLQFSDEIVVQTKSMEQVFKNNFKTSIPLSIYSYINTHHINSFHNKHKQTSDHTTSSFVYVSSGDPHKNHKNLIRAWVELANDSIFPKLELTLDPDLNKELLAYIDQKRIKHSLNIFNHGNLSHKKVIDVYMKNDAIIFPSLFESFGIPLLEARSIEMPILAPELDYVRDVVDPNETFDPDSPVSISRAVKRFSQNKSDVQDLVSANEFLKKLINE